MGLVAKVQEDMVLSVGFWVSVWKWGQGDVLISGDREDGGG